MAHVAPNPSTEKSSTQMGGWQAAGYPPPYTDTTRDCQAADDREPGQQPWQRLSWLLVGARAPLPWSARPGRPALLWPCVPVPAVEQPAARVSGCSQNTPEISLSTADPPPLLCSSPKSNCPGWFSPTSLSRRPDKQIRQARGHKGSCNGGAGLGGTQGEARKAEGWRQRSPLLC